MATLQFPQFRAANEKVNPSIPKLEPSSKDIMTFIDTALIKSRLIFLMWARECISLAHLIRRRNVVLTVNPGNRFWAPKKARRAF